MMINEDYFIKYLKNELTEEETRQLIAWVKEKKENQDFLFSLKDSYVYLNYENDCKEADTEHEWQKFAQRTGLSQQAGTPPKRRMCHGGVSSFTPLLSWSLPSWAGRPMLITPVSVHLWSWLLWKQK